MKMDSRSYSGKLFRPSPEIHIEGNGELVIVATPWGPRSCAKKIIKSLKDQFLSSRADREVTTPFAKLTCLSPLANDLRIAVKLANDRIYNEDNRNEYTAGVELFCMTRSQSEIAWIQVGYPFVFLDRPQRPLVPLGSQHDLSLEYSFGVSALAPLPGKLLGTEMTSDFSVESIRPGAHDRLILVSRSGVPYDFSNLPPGDRTLEQMSGIFSKDDAELPFWLGILSLS